MDISQLLNVIVADIPSDLEVVSLQRVLSCANADVDKKGQGIYTCPVPIYLPPSLKPLPKLRFTVFHGRKNTTGPAAPRT